MIFDSLHHTNRASSPALILRASLRRSGPFSKSQTLPVPVKAVFWEPTWEPADDLRGPDRGHLACVWLPSAPASALREVTHAADSGVFGKRTERFRAGTTFASTAAFGRAAHSFSCATLRWWRTAGLAGLRSPLARAGKSRRALLQVSAFSMALLLVRRLDLGRPGWPKVMRQGRRVSR
jgi:hypothetical protein